MQGGTGGQGFDVVAAWGRRKWLALAIFAVVLPSGVTIALSLPDMYASTATVVVDQVPGSGSDMESRLQLIRQEILSRARVEGLIQTLDLYPALRQRYNMAAAIDRMRRDIRIDSKYQPQPSGIGATISFAITARGGKPDVVATVANTIARAYLEEDQKLRARRASGAAEVLKTQLEDVKRNILEQERVSAAFQEQHSGELPQQAEFARATLSRLQADLRTAADERIRATDRRNELQKELANAADGGAPAGVNPTSASARLAKKKADLTDLSRRYSGKYPDVIRLKEEVAALEVEVAQAGPVPAAGDSVRTTAWLRAAVRDVESEVGALKADEARLKAEIAEHIRRLENAPRRQRDYLQIARDYQVTRELYESLRKRYEQALLEDVDGDRPDASPFRILEAALPPTSAAGPNRMLLMFASLVGALALGAAAAALAELVDTSFHSTDDIRSFTRVPIVGSIPRIVTPRDRRSRRRHVALAAVSLVVGIGLVVHTLHRVALTKDGLVQMLSKGRP